MCHKEKEPEEFCKDKRNSSGLAANCKACHTARCIAWNKQNPELHFERSKKASKIYHKKHPEKNNDWARNHPEERKIVNLKARLKFYHGITLEEYDILLKSQNGVCAICSNIETAKNGRLAVDHNHITGKNRQLLCSKCNTALGLVKENITVLNKMIEYINKHK